MIYFPLNMGIIIIADALDALIQFRCAENMIDSKLITHINIPAKLLTF